MPSPRRWLAEFTRLGEQGFFRGEPDFPEALALYRAEVEASDPRTQSWEWIAEMYERIKKGRPPATEAEYRDLADWYRRHEADRRVYSPNIRGSLMNTYSQGPRRLGATATIEEMRRLRAAHPELA
jgi:hypothetical protein